MARAGGGLGQENSRGGEEEEGVAGVLGTESPSVGPSTSHTVWLFYLWRGSLPLFLGSSAHSPALPCQAGWVKNKTSPATAPCQQGGR